jgi:uncharacterized membrane protein YwaF
MAWLYHFQSVQQFSAGLGFVEVGVAVLIALRPLSTKASAIGSGIAVLMFPDHVVMLVFNSRLGTNPWWLSSTFRLSRFLRKMWSYWEPSSKEILHALQGRRFQRVRQSGW